VCAAPGSPATLPAAEAGTEGMAKILVVDDSAFARARVARMLGDAGYTTCEAGDGHAAIDAYARERPDAVLMDITMPRGTS
jgi:CheY-like chemotaxis protein